MPSTLLSVLDLAADSAAQALARVVGDAGALDRFTAEIDELDSFESAEQLTGLHERLRAAVRELRKGETPDEKSLRVAQRLLECVAARESPVGAGLHALLRDAPYQFTPALVRALWQTRERERGTDELRETLDADTWSFVLAELLPLGVISSGRAGLGRDRAGYRLTPAGEDGLRAVARRVLQLELGRYPWPDGLPRPDSWASQAHVELFEFEHGGNDGVTVARCLGTDARSIGPLSMPSLFGVGRPEELAAGPFHSIAVLQGGAERWRLDGSRRIALVLDDHHKLQVRAEQLPTVHLDLTLFAASDVFEQYGQQLQTECDHADVAVSFAA